MLEAVHASSTLSAVVEEIRAGGANDEGGRMVAMVAVRLAAMAN
jgi:hypothetical protein